MKTVAFSILALVMAAAAGGAFVLRDWAHGVTALTAAAGFLGCAIQVERLRAFAWAEDLMVSLYAGRRHG